MPRTAPELIEREHIAAARSVITPYIRRTPVVEIRGTDVGIQGEVTLKLELLQHAGSFKARGAFANLLLRPIPAQRYLDRVVLVSEDDMREAQAALWSLCRIVAEPGGASAFAALLKGRYRPLSGERVGVVISGGNTVAVDFTR